jgi:hypothetical protein
MFYLRKLIEAKEKEKESMEKSSASSGGKISRPPNIKS